MIIDKPTFSDSELYCIESAVKEELQTFNKMDYSCLKKEDKNEIRDEMNNILSKIINWKDQEVAFTKAFSEMKLRQK